MACGTVQSQVSYLKRLPLYHDEKPFQLFIPIDSDAIDQRTNNLEFEQRECTFSDIRDNVHNYTLDDNAFQALSFPTKLDPTSFKNRSAVESRYFPEIEEILKKIEGGYDRVFIFDWRVNQTMSQTRRLACH